MSPSNIYHSPHFSFRPLVLTISFLFAGMNSAAAAEDSTPKATYIDTQPIVVTATRTTQPLSQAASSLSVLTEQDIQEDQPVTLGELLLDIPNVDVLDFAYISSQISIRGSNSSQITYLIDGMRQDDQTMAGNRPSGIFIDPEILKQVEVKHGGGSALYGNGGIGGTLAVTTMNANDFLKGTDRNFGAKVKAGYTSDNLEWQKSAYAFGRSNQWDVVFGVSRRDSGASTNSLTGKRSKADIDAYSTAAFGKASFMPNGANVLSLSYNFDRANSESDTFYRYEQQRVTGKWEFERGDLWNLTAALQYAHSKFHYVNPDPFRGINSKDKFDSVSGNVQNTSYLNGLGRHAVTYGFDFSKTSQSGLVLDQTTNEWNKDSTRPDADGFDGGFFIEDEYKINGLFCVVPVVRFNYFKRESNTGFPSLSDSKVTPGITLKMTPYESLLFWGSVHTGYRPPMLDEMYFYSTDYGQNVEVINNPNLKPEKSTNYEVGMSGLFGDLLTENDHLSWRVAVFYDDVKDFISVQDNMLEWWQGGMVGPIKYQTVNYGHVVNKGAELSGTYELNGFKASASYGYLHSEDKETGERLGGVTPQSANLRLSYKIAAAQLEPWYRLHWAKGGDTVPFPGYAATHLDGYTLHSVGINWTPKIPNYFNIQAGLAVTNLTNEKYVALFGMRENNVGYARGFRAWLSAQF